MKIINRPFRKKSAADILVLRDALGMKRYRKSQERDPQEREILIELGLNKIKKAEKNNFIPIGFRQRRFRVS